jgi:hypothetical protein
MVTLAAIASGSGVDDPDLAAVFEHLNRLAQPLAEANKPLQVIAPAVWMMHNRARTLEYTLHGKLPAASRLAQMVARAFSKTADFYVIITGIVPPSNPGDRIAYDGEVEFGRKLVEMTYRLLREVGGEPKQKWVAVEISERRCREYSAELEGLRKAHPLPEFAEQERIRRRSVGCAWVGWVFFFFFIAGRAGLFEEIIKAIVRFFTSG